MATNKEPKPRKLTPKQETFVREYVLTGNGSEAARKAYPNQKVPKVQATENLSKPYVVAEVERLRKPLRDRFPEIAETVVARLAKLFDDKKADARTTNAIGRTLLEVTGFIGGKMTATSVVINVNGESINLDEVGLIDLMRYRQFIEQAIEKRTAALAGFETPSVNNDVLAPRNEEINQVTINHSSTDNRSSEGIVDDSSPIVETKSEDIIVESSTDKQT